MADGAGETDAVAGLEGVDHCANGFEAPGDVGFGLVEIGDNGLSEVEEECFAGFGAVTLVCEGEFFVGSAAKFDEVEMVGFEAGAEFFGLFGVEPAFLEFNAVDFDADDKRFWDTGVDAFGDFHDDPGAVGEGATIFVGAFIGGWGEELGEEVAMGAVEFNTVKAGCVEVFCCVGKSFDDVLYILGRCRAGLLEGHAHNIAFQLDVTGRNGVFLDIGGYLTTWMADLTDNQTAICLASSCKLLEGFESFTLWRFGSRNDWIAGCLQVVVFNHNITGKD